MTRQRLMGRKKRLLKLCVVIGLALRAYTVEGLSSLPCELVLQQGGLMGQLSRKKLSEP